MYYLMLCSFFRFDPPDIDSSMCNYFEEKITLQLLSCTEESDSEGENYREWESVR